MFEEMIDRIHDDAVQKVFTGAGGARGRAGSASSSGASRSRRS